MTEHTGVVVVDEPEDDLDLIIAYLQERLDRERVAIVRQRLEDDPGFRDMAAPLLLAWTVPPRWKSTPMPQAELERHWDRFTKRAGFIHQRRKAHRRRLQLLGILLLVLVTIVGFRRDALWNWYFDPADYVPVRSTNEWVTIGEDVEARVAPGTRLLVRRVPVDSGADSASLEGTAEFRVQRSTYDPVASEKRPFYVGTRAGMVGSLRGTFTVMTSGDTTIVEVRTPAVVEKLGYFTLPTYVHVLTQRGDTTLRELERGRLVRNNFPEILP